MTIVTLTGDLGSMGRIARLAATTLDYDLLEAELTVAAGAAMAFPERRLPALDRRTGGLGLRLIKLMQGYLADTGETPARSMFPGGAFEEVLSRTYGETAGPRMTADDREYFTTLQHVVAYAAKRGNVVIVGRGAQLMLAKRRDAVHLRVYCPFEERVRRVARSDRRAIAAVRERVADSDRDRGAWHRKYFGEDYAALEHYHGVVNSGRLSDAASAAAVCDLVRSLAQRRSPRRS